MTDPERDPCIQIRDLEFGYGDGGFRLSLDLLEVPHGQRAVIIGPTGCGKTTFLHLLAGILVAERGSIEVAGHRLAALDEAERRCFRLGSIGMVFQEFELLEYLTVRENILLPFHIGRLRVHDDGVAEHLEAVTRRVGIGRLLDRRPRDLSHGERQRVAICRALVTRPELVLGDEPTGNLDPATTDEILALLFEEIAAHQATLLMVTHDHSLLDRFDAVIDLGELAKGQSS